MQKTQNDIDENQMYLRFQPDDAADVSLPYNGTSGWSGTDTSHDRAITADSDGTTGHNQQITLLYLRERKYEGITWKELADECGWHHGTASGVLSVLHKTGKIARLIEKRNKCRVYVLPEWVEGRETDTQGRQRSSCPHCGGAL